MVGKSAQAVGTGVGGGTSGNKMPTLEEYGTNLIKLTEEVTFVQYLTDLQFKKISFLLTRIRSLPVGKLKY